MSMCRSQVNLIAEFIGMEKLAHLQGNWLIMLFPSLLPLFCFPAHGLAVSAYIIL